MSDLKKQYLDLRLCEEQLEIRRQFSAFDKAKRFCSYLESNGINYEIVIKHKEVLGCDESEKYYERFSSYLDYGYSICKNLFLRERKGLKRHFLVITDSRKQIDLKELKEILDSKKLEFVPEDEMEELIHTYPGNVSLFNMIYDKDKKVDLIMDKELLGNSLLVFHPLYNGMSMFIEPEECIKFLNLIKRKPNFVEIIDKENEKKYIRK